MALAVLYNYLAGLKIIEELIMLKIFFTENQVL